MHRVARVELSSPGVTTYADGEPVAPLPAIAECVPGALRVVGTARTSRRHRSDPGLRSQGPAASLQ